MARVSREGERIFYPPPTFNGVDYSVYEVTLCANDTERGPCNRQAERGHNSDWQCQEHGRCDSIAVAVAESGVRVVLGYRTDPDA